MLAQRLRRWANTVPTLSERRVFAGYKSRFSRQVGGSLALRAKPDRSDKESYEPGIQPNLIYQCTCIM